MAQPSTGHVFMSYRRRDDLVLRRVVAFLRKQGIKVWMDHEQLEPGTPIWEEEIEKGIRGASAIVVLMSPDSKTSEWVRREISCSEQYRQRIFPVLVAGDEESSITLRLITRQYVDIRQAEEEGLRLLGATLLTYLEGLNIEERDAEEPQAVHLPISETAEINEEKRVVTPGLSELPNLSQQTDKVTSPHKWSSILWGTLGNCWRNHRIPLLDRRRLQRNHRWSIRWGNRRPCHRNHFIR
ncbi:MAG TPA: toll/interleukin-1 receptor domain-containing protein [Anaerolineales bacterium]|nr:toll/interleukin-1 receptor domain-containing protein [Anaerolineales bacterium]